MGYRLPDPHPFFYEPHPLGVRFGLTLPRLLPEDPAALEFQNKGFLIGGGGRGEAARRSFLACAYWNAALSTDAQGRVTASFPAPDNLTRYRLMAVVHADRDRFGAGESAFQINKPLMIEPALPPFAHVGDRLRARAVVHNRTDQPANVAVSLTLDGTATADGGGTAPPAAGGGVLTNRLTAAPQGSVAADFPVQFVAPGAARWLWRVERLEAPAVGAPARDAVEAALSVQWPAPLLREVHLARVVAGATNLLAAANPQLLAGKGAATVRVANTRLAELGEGIRRLLEYPYGCVEQTSSSLLPWIVLRDAPAALFPTGAGPAEVETVVRNGISRLFTMQAARGGLAYWPGDQEPNLWGSAYAALVLGLAKQHGFAVPERGLENLLTWLAAALRERPGREHGAELDDHCLAVYALAVGRHAEPAYHELLYNQRARLSSEARAWLALAILEGAGAPDWVQDLLAVRSRPPAAELFRFGNDASTLGARLLAWTHLRPAAPQVQVLAAELLHARAGGHWGSTQGNAWSLFALSDYAKRVETSLSAAQGQLAWAGREERFELPARASVVERVFAYGPDKGVGPFQLASASAAPLFTQITLEARPLVLRQPRQDRGFALQRAYARLDQANVPGPLDRLSVGDRVLVSLTLQNHSPAHFLVVDDPLPALFEAINPKFVTQATASDAALSQDWVSTHHELRADRALFFCDSLLPGRYTLRYLARVRAAGVAAAPPAKVEEMYHPERFGLSETLIVTAIP